MELSFESKKFENLCNEHRKLVTKHGPKRAKKIRQRLDDLRAADNFDVMKKLPGRFHALVGDREGTFSLDLDHPNRLIFKPNDDPLPERESGGLDWSKVTKVLIIGVEDTHE